MNTSLPNVGLIGIGLVGKALAERLLQAGFRVVGFDVEARCVDELVRLGGEAAASTRAVAQAADLCLISLPDSAIAGQVLNEIAPQLTGKRVVDTTTGDPAQSAAVGRQLAKQGIDLLDATIVGSSKQVRNGEVIVLVGGEERVFRQCLPVFSCFARQSFYLGPWGSGARMKLVVNLVLGLNRAVLAEGLAFADACGIQPAQALEILQSSVAYSRVMDTKGQKMLAHDFSVEAKLAQHHKDVRLILAAAHQSGASVPLSMVHDDLLTAAESLGLGEMDNSAIIKVYHKTQTA